MGNGSLRTRMVRHIEGFANPAPALELGCLLVRERKRSENRPPVDLALGLVYPEPSENFKETNPARIETRA